jgi:hypothetical protein
VNKLDVGARRFELGDFRLRLQLDVTCYGCIGLLSAADQNSDQSEDDRPTGSLEIP